MIKRFIQTRRARLIFGLLAIVIGFGATAFYVSRKGLSYREVIVVLAALIGAVIVFGRERGIRFGFVLWVLTLALGYRTISWTPELAIHPAEALLWLLMICISVQRQLVSSTRLMFPVWLWLLIPFWLLAWWPLISGGMPWDRMLNEFRNFLLLIPLMIVASVVLQRERYWRYLLLAFFFASSWIALMGILEYWFPQVTSLVPSFVRNATPALTQEGFMRANFSFWGGPPATFICVLALPSAIVLVTWWRQRLHRAAIVGASVLQILAVYIGGYRSIWLVLVIQVMTACLLRLRKQGAVVALMCVITVFGGYELIPRTSERVMSGIAVLSGQPNRADSSGRARQGRALGALSSALESPYGSGWSSAGWAHSDFLQVAVNLGLVAGLIFIGGYLHTMLRLARRVLPNLRMGEHRDLGLSLMLSMIAAGGILAMEGVTVLPQLVLPVWFIWVLTEVWLRQTAGLREFNDAVGTSYPYRLAPVRLPPARVARSQVLRQ